MQPLLKWVALLQVLLHASGQVSGQTSSSFDFTFLEDRGHLDMVHGARFNPPEVEGNLPLRTLLQLPEGPKNYDWQKNVIDNVKKNNRIVVCGANYGFRSWIQQWYVSLRRTGVTEIVIIALDQQVFEWAKEMIGEAHVIHFDLIDDQEVIGSAHRWRTKSYVQVVSQRAHILKPIIEMGVDVLYADTDITWFKNPWDFIPNLGTSTQCDYYVQQEKSEVIGDYNCSGFMFIRASLLTKLFMKIWEDKIIERVKKPGFFTDQEELNFLFEEIYRGHRKGSVEWKDFKACVLPAASFPVGVQYYFQKTKAKVQKGKEVKISSDCKLGKECLGFTFSPLAKPDKKWDKNPPVIVHHNYIKGNIEKVDRAKKFGLWLKLREDEFQ
mmetsp:Transcript_15755/g.26586  ORF Transcript_15755/g.26586 Transcript_15755/m.26586 type:complete len:382 (+) Transcript_15755:146-1291(+)|eukprot:CAMPEP_0198213172 /NCGR_PEP_ID=MMETSP1445-20131203/28718_1 /TAXON_ID=36898 /ORGANISM="Pyramimonas sp., Strain CCMP2087" /LENGTH=381 /DNA_ID=CAMNT_0043887783 /DNA_START=139 /DNA_END=1284 /DNA_ORIENTATION=-